METLCVRVPLRVLFVFKSYYVVWKLINDINTKDTVDRV